MPLGSVMAMASAACSMAVARRSALASARSRLTSLIPRKTMPSTSSSMTTMVKTTSRRLVSRMVTGRVITVAPTGGLDAEMPITSSSRQSYATNDPLTQALFIDAVNRECRVPGELSSKFWHVYEHAALVAGERGSQDNGIARECRHSVHDLCDCCVRGKRKRSAVLKFRDDALDGSANSNSCLSEVRDDVDTAGMRMQPERQRERPRGIDLLGHARDILRSPEQRRLIVVDAAEHDGYVGKQSAAVAQGKVQRRVVSNNQDVGSAGAVAGLKQLLDLIVVLLRGESAPVEVLHRELDPRR